MPTTGEISLYFHIPFCRRKCPYCHFYVVPHNEGFQTILLKALRQEWQLYQHLTAGKKIVSVYFGGGTPFLFGPTAIQEILSWVRAPKEAEITLEANPEDVTLEAMQAYAKAGINRVSLGVQSLDDATLKMLGRHHTAEQAKQAVVATSQAIDNITIDLMYEIPSQRLPGWIETLNQATQLPIRHLSLYNLTFEPQTVYFKKRSELTPLLPSSDESLQMLNAAVEILEKKLPRYEISAFAEKGFESKHNTGYWEGRPFLGFGPSAFSDWEGRRYRNSCDLKKYAEALDTGKSPVDFEEKLSPLASLHERLAIRLRLLSGIEMKDYPVDPKIYQKLEEKGWIKLEKNRACLTQQGLLFYDSVAEEVVLTP
jgi:oxygen-independent coproporphyrinogen III oxidase